MRPTDALQRSQADCNGAGENDAVQRDNRTGLLLGLIFLLTSDENNVRL